MNIFTKPSFLSNGIQGLLMLWVLILLYHNWNRVIKWSIYEKIVILLLISMVVGLHGLIHLGLEKVYGWNPLEGKMDIKKK
jgi:hypothetical protein